MAILPCHAVYTANVDQCLHNSRVSEQGFIRNNCDTTRVRKGSLSIVISLVLVFFRLHCNDHFSLFFQIYPSSSGVACFVNDRSVASFAQDFNDVPHRAAVHIF